MMWGGAPKPYSMGIVDVHQGGSDPLSEETVAEFIRKPPAAYCGITGKKSRVFRWRVKRTGQFVSDAINQRADIGPVHTIRALKRGRSGRALSVEYVGSRGAYVLDGSYKNRKLLGGLRSGMWTVARTGGQSGGQPGSWRFSGGGFGHGVGMCQHGAMGMAKGGQGHESILKHYYRGSVLKKAW